MGNILQDSELFAVVFALQGYASKELLVVFILMNVYSPGLKNTPLINQRKKKSFSAHTHRTFASLTA